MRLRYALGWITVLLFALTGARAADPELVPTTTPNYSNYAVADYPDSGGYLLPSLYAQDWLTPGYSFYGGDSGYSRHFPYLYFYEQYAREAEESRRAADEFEASLAREGKLTGPLEVGAFATDFIPRSPIQQELTLDGRAVAPSPSGAPLVIESGEHTLRIGNGQISTEN